MTKPDPTLEQFMQHPQAASLLKNKELIRRLMASPDTQKLMQLLNQNGTGALENAAASAAKGDTGALMGMVSRIMQSKEGAQLVERINQSIPKDK